MPRGIEPTPPTTSVKATDQSSTRGIDPGPHTRSVNDADAATRKGVGPVPSEPGGTR